MRTDYFVGGGAADFIPLPPSAYNFIIWNLFLTDKLTPLCASELRENNIEEIVAILPSEADFEPLKGDIGTCGYRVLAYGDEHVPSLPVEEYDKVAQLIDNLARNKSANGAKRNVLLFCNNGYQRSLPFLVYYLKKFHGDEFPTTERAVGVILAAIRKSHEMEGYLKALCSLPL